MKDQDIGESTQLKFKRYIINMETMYVHIFKIVLECFQHVSRQISEMKET